MLNIIETFSGIGSQVQALKNLQLEHSVKAIVEWEIGAIYAYDIMHNGPQDLAPYRHHTKESLIKLLEKYNLSADGKEPITSRALVTMSVIQLKSILCAIDRTNNLVDITSVSATDLPSADILTYSFPCQDLSVSGHWHHNIGGIDRDANNRSTLLWEIERILKEFIDNNKELPRFLLMENVSNILSAKHIDNFNEWKNFLEELGYVNKVYTLDARNFGVPQSRIRAYMVSVLTTNIHKKEDIINYFDVNDLERKIISKTKMNALSKYLKLDYSINKYRSEAVESTPTYTLSRQKIYENNTLLAYDDEINDFEYARTITTKQDRHPNSGIIGYDNIILTPTNTKYRNLTPRECFLLMGFDEKQFDLLMEYNIYIGKNKKILSNSKLIRLAGNSIVVPVLESIFEQINDINNIFFQPKKANFKIVI